MKPHQERERLWLLESRERLKSKAQETQNALSALVDFAKSEENADLSDGEVLDHVLSELEKLIPKPLNS
jgi:hypothetical protein